VACPDLQHERAADTRLVTDGGQEGSQSIARAAADADVQFVTTTYPSVHSSRSTSDRLIVKHSGSSEKPGSSERDRCAPWRAPRSSSSPAV
jgi:hypothetical protein